MWLLAPFLSSQDEAVKPNLFTRDTSCLPSAISSDTPDCAETCVQNYIANNFGQPNCQTATNLTYLCTTKSKSGLTIGEGGLQCVVSDCGPSANISIYNVCSGIKGAQPRLAGTITATVASPTPTSQTSSTSSTSSLVLTSMAFTTASSPFPANPTTSVAAAKASTTTGQVAGIAVGSVAGAFGLVGLLLFFCCKKRRQQKEERRSRTILKSTTSSMTEISRDSSPMPPETAAALMTISRAASPSPLTPESRAAFASSTSRISAGMGSISALAASIGQHESQQAPTEHRRSFWRRSINPEEIGVAVSPKDSARSFRISNITNRAKTRSMIPIPESAVLPNTKSPQDFGSSPLKAYDDMESQSTDDESQIDIKNDKLPSTTAPGFLQVPQEQRAFSFDDQTRPDDVEAQGEVAMDSARGSLLSSVRASIAGVSAMLARKVSIKREKVPPRPLLLISPNNSRKLQNPVNRYPLTPKYDNGNFVADPPAVDTMPQHNSSYRGPEMPMKIPRKPTFSSFIAGKLLPTSGLRSPPVARSKYGNDQAHPPMPLRQGTELFFNTQNMDRGITNEVDDKSSPEIFSIRQLGQKLRSPGMLPAPLSIRKGLGGNDSRDSILSSSTRGLQYPPVPSSANVSSQNQVPWTPPSRTPRERFSHLRSPQNIQQYARKPLPSLDPRPDAVPKFITSSPPASKANEEQRDLSLVTSPVEMSPKGKPGFPSVANSMTSMYIAFKSPMSSRFTPPPPLPLRDYLSANNENRGVSEVLSPDSAEPGRNSLTPKWFTPNRTKTGDLVLTVGGDIQ